MDHERTGEARPIVGAALELGSLLAGIPIALVVLLVGAVGGVVGLGIASAALIAAAVICARRSYLGLAGGLLLGLGLVVALMVLLAEARPDF